MTRESERKSWAFDAFSLGAIRAVGWLPRRGAMRLGSALGRLALLCLYGKRERIETNLRLAGVEDAARARMRAGRSIGATILEIVWLTSESRGDVLREVELEGLDTLRAALAEGKGVLLVAAHLGNWELVAQSAALAGAPVAVVARSLGTPRVERRVNAFRNRGGVETLTRGAPGASVAAYRHLRRGGVLGCMMDGSRGGRRIVIPFLAQGLRIPVGPAELALRSGSAVVLGGARRDADGRTHVSFERMPSVDGEDTPALTRRIGAALEEQIRERPEDWYGIYRHRPRAPDRPRERRPETAELASS